MARFDLIVKVSCEAESISKACYIIETRLSSVDGVVTAPSADPSLLTIDGVQAAPRAIRARFGS